MNGARTAHVVHAGGYLPRTTTGGYVRVRPAYWGIRCDACEWTVTIPHRFGFDRLERLRRQHLQTAHLSELIAGTVVFDVDRSQLFA